MLTFLLPINFFIFQFASTHYCMNIIQNLPGQVLRYLEFDDFSSEFIVTVLFVIVFYLNLATSTFE